MKAVLAWQVPPDGAKSAPLSIKYPPVGANLPPLLIDDHRADRFTLMHQVEGIVDVVEGHSVGDQVVDIDLAIHEPVDDFRYVGAAAGAAERGAFPHAPGDQLERSRRDLLAGAGDADDD